MGWGCLGVNVSRWVKRKVVVVVGAVVVVVVVWWCGRQVQTGSGSYRKVG